MAGFIALFALAIFGLIWVQSKIDLNVKLAGRSVAKLPSQEYDFHWLSNDKMLIQVPEYLYTQGKNNYPVRFQVLNIKDGSLDQLAGLNNWVNSREAGAGTLLNHEPDALSPDGKWVFTSEEKWVGTGAWTGTNRFWLLSSDGTKQVSLKNSDGFC